MTRMVQAALRGRWPALPNASLRLFGPGLLVAVGYMDPGNWATDIAGGSLYGYALASVVLLSGLFAMAVQLLVARVTVASGEDLASLSARLLPRRWAAATWLAGEAAILATALAELLGGAIALQLLLGVSLELGMVLSALGTFAVLGYADRGGGLHEILVSALVAVVVVSFLLLAARSHPDWSHVLGDTAMLGHLAGDRDACLTALGIVGATIMPHSLYLHSGLLAERYRGLAAVPRRQALRLVTGDTVASLSVATLVNAAIMGVAAASLGGAGIAATSLAAAHGALATAIGLGAALIFALALYAAGQSSAITGVLAGRFLTQGFRGRAGSTYRRGVATRLVGVALGFLLLRWFGDGDPDHVIVLTQVLLSLALPFALVPLMWLASRRAVMRDLALGRGAMLALSAMTAAIIALDLATVIETVWS